MDKVRMVTSKRMGSKNLDFARVFLKKKRKPTAKAPR